MHRLARIDRPLSSGQHLLHVIGVDGGQRNTRIAGVLPARQAVEFEHVNGGLPPIRHKIEIPANHDRTVESSAHSCLAPTEFIDRLPKSCVNGLQISDVSNQAVPDDLAVWFAPGYSINPYPAFAPVRSPRTRVSLDQAQA